MLTGAAIVSIIGFPVALVLAWVFDVAPERPDSGDATGGAEVALPPRTILLVAVLLLAGVGVGWILKPGASGADATTSGIPSIAVLPFENASHDGRVFIPISSMEVVAPLDPSYECCSSSGAIAALSAADGTEVWYHRVIRRPADEISIAGPAGGAVWSSPTIDVGRGLLYFSTGQNYGRPTTGDSDAMCYWPSEFGHDEASSPSSRVAYVGRMPRDF